MASILLIITFFLLWIFIFISKRRNSHFKDSLFFDDLRISFLYSSIIWPSVLLAITEILSAVFLLTFFYLFIAWIIVFAVVLLILFYKIGYKSAYRSIIQIPGKFGLLSYTEFFCLSVCTLLLVATLFLALYYPPNTWDSMTYHMSRVFFWIQHQNVDYYPTNNLRQLNYQPLAEYIILNFKILSNSDRLVNFVQWFAYLGSIVNVSLITRELGGTRKAEIISMLVAATIPMAILQASSTQNDMVNTFFITCFVYFILRLSISKNVYILILTGLSLGLALLTKGVAYVVAIPFFIYFFSNKLKVLKVLQWKIVYIFIILAIAIVVNLGYYLRNISAFDHPLGNAQDKLQNEIIGLRPLVSNVSRNIFLHATTPVRVCNSAVYNSLLWLHKTMNYEINNKQTTFSNTTIARVPNTFSYHEDTTQNFFHLILLILSVLLFILYRFSEKKKLTFYLLAIILGFLLFSVYLKWQPWNSRLHLPFFVLSAPFIAVVIDRFKTLKNFSLIVLSIFALPCIYLNQSRPLPLNYAAYFNRYDMVFMNQPKVKDSYKNVVDYLTTHRIRKIGLMLGGDDWDYPLCNFLEENLQNFRIEHVNVYNASKSINLRNEFSPNCIVSTRTNKAFLEYNKIKYSLALSNDYIRVYVK